MHPPNYQTVTILWSINIHESQSQVYRNFWQAAFKVVVSLTRQTDLLSEAWSDDGEEGGRDDSGQLDGLPFEELWHKST